MTDLSQRLNEAMQEDSAHLEMRKRHITAWRYRVYVFVIIVIIVIVEPMFTSTLENLRGKGAFKFSLKNPISMYTNRGEGGKLNELDEAQKLIDETNDTIATTKLQIEIVENLQTPEKQNTLLNCINRDMCESIQAGLLSRIDLLRSFLMIDHLAVEKLDFDQKFVLRNINEFLATQIGRGNLVTIKDITFGSPAEVKAEYKLMKIPVTLSISYFANSDFMAFLHNIESKVSPELPIMRRIEAVNYDIVNYLDAQDVAMSLAIYYIAGPKTDMLALSLSGVQAEGPGTGDVYPIQGQENELQAHALTE